MIDVTFKGGSKHFLRGKSDFLLQVTSDVETWVSEQKAKTRIKGVPR
jgi:hypothetical protein